jgi:hypothetical protein
MPGQPWCGLAGSREKSSIASWTAGQAGLQVTEREVVEDGSALVLRGQKAPCRPAPSRHRPHRPEGRWERLDMYRAGPGGRLNRHFLATGWNVVRLQLLGQAPDLSA